MSYEIATPPNRGQGKTMYQLIFANIDTIALGGSMIFVVWLATRWTHGRKPWQWFKKPEKVRNRLNYIKSV